MAFNSTEQEIIKVGVQNGKTRQEVEQALVNYRSGVVPSQGRNEQPGYLSRLGGELGNAFRGLQDTTSRGAELMQGGKPIQGAVMSGLGTAGGFIRGALSPITAAIAPTVQKVIQDSGITDNAQVQEVMQKVDTWAKENPDLAKNTQNVIEIATTLVGAKGVTSAVPFVKKTAQTGVEAVQTGVETATKAVAPIVRSATDAAGMVAEGAARVPGRVATNVAEKQALNKSIGELSSDVAKAAVRDGLDINDVKSLYQMPKTVKPQAKELFETVKKFAAGDKTVDPIETVGRPIVARLKELDSLKGEIGQKLGVVAENLGNVTAKEMYPAVFANLKKIPGLSGLTVSTKGILNFKNTVLTTAETAADRRAIQSMFTSAIKNGTGKQKHLLRQELFEVLGGKKKSLSNLTDTQEKAYEAIRKGLADVLDAKNPEYKALNMEFARTVRPLTDMRKAMRAVHGATEDVLDMNAGLLARRLTSTSLSQGQLRTILEALDNATVIKGSTLETTEGLQNLYNILSKTYNLAPSTGFEGSIKNAVTSGGGFIDRITKALGGVAGETPAVRQKALENVLDDILQDLVVTPAQTTKTTKAITSKAIPNPTTPRPVSKELSPLLSEARKYKTAEEFVSSLKPFTHSSSKEIGAFEDGVGRGNGAVFASKFGDKYAVKAGGVQNQFIPTGEQKILDPRRTSDAVGQSVLREATENIAKQDGVRYVYTPAGNLKIESQLDVNVGHIPGRIQGEVIRIAKERGYTQVLFPEPNGEYSHAFLYPKSLLTKSQLTDLWKKAHNK